jgi:uncharacterized protein (DUF2062 family)
MIQNAFLQKKIIHPLINLLKQGITAERLALSLAMGITIGSFPVMGTTTVICTVIALAFRLNLPVIQIGNWLAYPIQIALIVPFMLLGERMFGSGNILTAHPLLTPDLSGFVHGFGTMSAMAFHGIILWSFTAPAQIIALYFLFLPLFRRWKATAGG